MERPAGFDIVQRPKHYNSHPSGVECIEIIEHMTFNLGNATKYVWRGGLKLDDPLQDYEKALWYLRREFERKPIILPTNRQIEHFRMVMMEDNRARRVLARPSPWCEPIRKTVSYIIDIHCTAELQESIRLHERALQCLNTAIADQRCMGRQLENGL